MSYLNYPVILDINNNEFPPVELALVEPDGLLAIGGDLNSQRIINAYSQGIFPWYSEGEPLMWWSPNPRSVIFTDEFKASKSLQKLCRKSIFKTTTNTVFTEVIKACSKIPRQEQDGTWITDEMIDAYVNLNEQGVALSFETWKNDQLVGGLYGLRIEKLFFGESMFSLVSNASKVAFIELIDYCKTNDIHLIDCQVESEHMNSLGARNISRQKFSQILQENASNIK